VIAQSASCGSGSRLPLGHDACQIYWRHSPDEGEERHDVPPSVQGANTGCWQAGGVTRAGAKRSKRP
jgi:hypothetical protein